MENHGVSGFNSMYSCALAKGIGDQKNLDSDYKNNFNNFMVLEKSKYLIERLLSIIHILSYLIVDYYLYHSIDLPKIEIVKMQSSVLNALAHRRMAPFNILVDSKMNFLYKQEMSGIIRIKLAS